MLHISDSLEAGIKQSVLICTLTFKVSEGMVTDYADLLFFICSTGLCVSSLFGAKRSSVKAPVGGISGRSFGTIHNMLTRLHPFLIFG